MIQGQSTKSKILKIKIAVSGFHLQLNLDLDEQSQNKTTPFLIAVARFQFHSQFTDEHCVRELSPLACRLSRKTRRFSLLLAALKKGGV